MGTLLQNVLSSTHWGYVVVATIVSLVLGSIWYHKGVFGSAYMKSMHGNKDNMCGSMTGMLVHEALSRVLYFIGLGWLLAGRGTSFESMAPGAVLVWLFYVVSTQWSLLTWSPSSKKALWIVAGKMLLDTLLAAWIFGMVK